MPRRLHTGGQERGESVRPRTLPCTMALEAALAAVRARDEAESILSRFNEQVKEASFSPPSPRLSLAATPPWERRSLSLGRAPLPHLPGHGMAIGTRWEGGVEVGEGRPPTRSNGHPIVLEVPREPPANCHVCCSCRHDMGRF